MSQTVINAANILIPVGMKDQEENSKETETEREIRQPLTLLLPSKLLGALNCYLNLRAERSKLLLATLIGRNLVKYLL